MRVALIVLFSFGLTWSSCSSSFAMLTIETDGVLLYFPEGETEIAARLSRNLADILIFLQKKGLPVQRPLYIILDENLDRRRHMQFTLCPVYEQGYSGPF